MAYKVYTIDSAQAGGTFQALGPEEAISVPPQTSAGGGFVSLAQGWAYTIGNGTVIRRDRVQAAALGTRLVAHTIGSSSGQVERVRVILLDDSHVEVTFDGIAGSRELRAANTYVDVSLDRSGSFNGFGQVEDFDHNSTPGSEGLMDEIDAARAEHGIE